MIRQPPHHTVEPETEPETIDSLVVDDLVIDDLAIVTPSRDLFDQSSPRPSRVRAQQDPDPGVDLDPTPRPPWTSGRFWFLATCWLFAASPFVAWLTNTGPGAGDRLAPPTTASPPAAAGGHPVTVHRQPFPLTLSDQIQRQPQGATDPIEGLGPRANATASSTGTASTTTSTTASTTTTVPAAQAQPASSAAVASSEPTTTLFHPYTTVLHTD